MQTATLTSFASTEDHPVTTQVNPDTCSCPRLDMTDCKNPINMEIWILQTENIYIQGTTLGSPFKSSFF